MTFLKYPGGKTSELPIIKQYLPRSFNKYYEPFVGGGAVYFDINAKRYFINDKSSDLISLYNSVKNQDNAFFENVRSTEYAWNGMKKISKECQNYISYIIFLYENDMLTDNELAYIIHSLILNKEEKIKNCLQGTFVLYKDVLTKEIEKYLIRKIKNIKKIEYKKGKLSIDDLNDNIEGMFKGGYYMFVRDLYNISQQNPNEFNDEFISSVYLFIREMCYSSMFRFNSNGDFNVPYGGITYNKKSFDSRLKYYQTQELKEKLSNTTIGCMDFYDFVKKFKPRKRDFLFIDPPYDSEFSEYDKASFVHEDQRRLANYLINECDGKFMVVIKNTEFISSLYPIGTITKNGGKINVIGFDKHYMVSFMNRNDKKCEHVIITNYDIKEV